MQFTSQETEILTRLNFEQFVVSRLTLNEMLTLQLNLIGTPQGDIATRLHCTTRTIRNTLARVQAKASSFFFSHSGP